MGNPRRPPTVCTGERIFAFIKKRMVISNRQDELGSDFLAPSAFPEAREGDTHEGFPQDCENNATGNADESTTGESALDIQRPSTGVFTPRISDQ